MKDLMNTQAGGGDGLTYDMVIEFMRGQDWPVTSVLVAERFGISQQAAYYRLRTLAEEGTIERTKIGQTVLWRPSDR